MKQAAPRRDPRLLNCSPNIVAAPHVQTRLADEWAQSEIEGHVSTLERMSAFSAACTQDDWLHLHTPPRRRFSCLPAATGVA